MVETRRLRFAQQALHDVGIFRACQPRHLQRDGTFKLRVPREVDRSLGLTGLSALRHELFGSRAHADGVIDRQIDIRAGLAKLTRSVSEGERSPILRSHSLSERSPSLTLRVSCHHVVWLARISIRGSINISTGFASGKAHLLEAGNSRRFGATINLSATGFRGRREKLITHRHLFERW